jgi:hypothetical protein
METLFGFVAGYIVGCNEGNDGIKRLRESVKAIMESGEVRRMAGEVVTVAEAAVRRAAARQGFDSLSGTVGTVTDILAHRAAAIGRGNRAA